MYVPSLSTAALAGVTVRLAVADLAESASDVAVTVTVIGAEAEVGGE
jgi:hypothetical protein